MNFDDERMKLADFFLVENRRIVLTNKFVNGVAGCLYAPESVLSIEPRGCIGMGVVENGLTMMVGLSRMLNEQSHGTILLVSNLDESDRIPLLGGIKISEDPRFIDPPLVIETPLDLALALYAISTDENYHDGMSVLDPQRHVLWVYNAEGAGFRAFRREEIYRMIGLDVDDYQPGNTRFNVALDMSLLDSTVAVYTVSGNDSSKLLKFVEGKREPISVEHNYHEYPADLKRELNYVRWVLGLFNGL